MFDDVVTIHFLHQYAILFVIEVAIMLGCGWIAPRKTAWQFTRNEQVDLTPWRFAKPLAVTLFSCVVATYLLFSPIGAASPDGPGTLFAGLMGALFAGNVGLWALSLRRAGSLSR